VNPAVPITTVDGRPAVEIVNHEGEVWTYALAAERGPAGWTCYQVARTDDPEGAHRHTVRTNGQSWECSCPAWRYRRRWNRTSCKHVDSVRALGPWLKALEG